MRNIATFGHLLPDTVTYATMCSTGDVYGDVIWATGTSYRARVVGEQKKIRSFTGDEVVSQHTVYLMAAIVAQPDARITLSTDIVGSTAASAINPPILGAKRIPDQAGIHHAVIYLG